MSRNTIIWVDSVLNPHTTQVQNQFPILKGRNILWVKEYDEFVGYVTTRGLPHNISMAYKLREEDDFEIPQFWCPVTNSFKHKIQIKRKTGCHCLAWLMELCIEKELKLPHITFHEWKNEYRDKLQRIYENYGEIYKAQQEKEKQKQIQYEIQNN